MSEREESLEDAQLDESVSCLNCLRPHSHHTKDKETSNTQSLRRNAALHGQTDNVMMHPVASQEKLLDNHRNSTSNEDPQRQIKRASLKHDVASTLPSDAEELELERMLNADPNIHLSWHKIRGAPFLSLVDGKVTFSAQILSSLTFPVRLNLYFGTPKGKILMNYEVVSVPSVLTVHPVLLPKDITLLAVESVWGWEEACISLQPTDFGLFHSVLHRHSSDAECSRRNTSKIFIAVYFPGGSSANPYRLTVASPFWPPLHQDCTKHSGRIERDGLSFWEQRAIQDKALFVPATVCGDPVMQQAYSAVES